MDTPILEFRNVSFERPETQFSKPHRWTEVQFSVFPKDLLVIAGPSGIGKSTILSLVCGIEDLDRNTGKIILNGREISGLSPLERNVGISFQGGLGLFQDKSARYNIEFPLSDLFQSDEKSTDLESDIVGKLELDFWLFDVPYHPGLIPDKSSSILETRVSKLSGGQKQRVALARCFANPNKVLYLLDEPFNGQDPPLRDYLGSSILERFNSIRRNSENTAMIMVTHRRKEALGMADRIMFLEKRMGGQITTSQLVGPKEIYDEPLNISVATFFGTYLINTTRSKKLLRHEKLKLPHGAKFCAVRPEHIWLSVDQFNKPDILSFRTEVTNHVFQGAITLLKLYVSDIDGYWSVITSEPEKWLTYSELYCNWKVKNTLSF